MRPLDHDLRELVNAIVAGDVLSFSRLLARSPALARASFDIGATRTTAKIHFIAQIKRYIFAGDTALHFAAAAYRSEIAQQLLATGANVHASNRLGDQPLHAAAVGSPGSPAWDPIAQTATISCLLDAGADPNASNKNGATPLHKAVRTRCAAAVQLLLERGANPASRNRTGSTPIRLAALNTGRSGSGLAEAKSQQQEILRLFASGLSRLSR
jgi:Ankyrin repeats (many copies)/Ankyrin repeat